LNWFKHTGSFIRIIHEPLADLKGMDELSLENSLEVGIEMLLSLSILSFSLSLFLSLSLSLSLFLFLTHTHTSVLFSFSLSSLFLFIFSSISADVTSQFLYFHSRKWSQPKDILGICITYYKVSGVGAH
jgi:hypothetical protein